MCNLLNHICFVQSFEPYLLCTIFGTLFALCNLSTPKKVLPTEATTFASLATIYIYRLKFPLCAAVCHCVLKCPLCAAFLKIQSHTNPSTTGPAWTTNKFLLKKQSTKQFYFRWHICQKLRIGCRKSQEGVKLPRQGVFSDLAFHSSRYKSLWNQPALSCMNHGDTRSDQRCPEKGFVEM